MLDALHGAGWAMQGGMGNAPLTALEVAAWASGTMADLGPQDFQDVLTVSRAFISAVGDYDGLAIDPPWSPPMTEDEAVRMAAAQERIWDAIMGVS